MPLSVLQLAALLVAAAATVVPGGTVHGDTFVITGGFEIDGATCLFFNLGSGTSTPISGLFQFAIDQGFISADGTCTTGLTFSEDGVTGGCPTAAFSFGCSNNWVGPALICDPSTITAPCTGIVDDMLFCTEELAQVYWVDTNGQVGVQDVPSAGGAGDPVLTDFKGHTFLSGGARNTEYTLYQSALESISMTTSAFRGDENGFFVEKLRISRDGCGTVELRADDHKVAVDGPNCFASAVGDEGMVVLPMTTPGTDLAVFPHKYSGSSGGGFLNFKIVGATDEFVRSCTAGLLCDEEH